MMKPSELYKLWAPEDSIWSNWAKPVLFADHAFDDRKAQTTDWRSLNLSWAPSAGSSTAIVLDLPDADAVWLGVALSQRGFRPVPLYNGVRGPLSFAFPLVNVENIVWALHSLPEVLAGLQLPPDAPPVFLLDYNRMAGGSMVSPGRFDNRWSVFPQDFPSANFLLSHGLHSVVLVQAKPVNPHRDLAHVLLRWQEAGIKILSCGADDQTQPAPIQVARPNNFRTLWYQALVIAGLRRNSAGGFGAVVPEPSSGGGFG